MASEWTIRVDALNLPETIDLLKTAADLAMAAKDVISQIEEDVYTTPDIAELEAALHRFTEKWSECVTERARNLQK